MSEVLIETPEKTEKIWSCKIGPAPISKVPNGADLPMREAVEAMFHGLTGVRAQFNFSGWGAELTESELAVIEDRPPSADHHRLWNLQQTGREQLHDLRMNLEGAIIDYGDDISLETIKRVAGQLADLETKGVCESSSQKETAPDA